MRLLEVLLLRYNGTYEMNLHRTNYTRTRVCPHTHAHTLSPQNPAKSARALWMALTSFSFPEPPPGCTSEDAPIAGNMPSPNCRRPHTRLELAPDYAGASRPLPSTARVSQGDEPTHTGSPPPLVNACRPEPGTCGNQGTIC